MIVRDAIHITSTHVFDYLARDAEVPVVTSAACQGDVSILRVTTTPATTPLAVEGIAVVRSEAGGNTHSLHCGSAPDPFTADRLAPVVCWDAAPARAGSLTIGTLTIPDGAAAILAHPEHGYLEIAPGTYRVGRQREWAGEWRIVAD